MPQLSFTARYFRFVPEGKSLGRKEHELNLDKAKTALLAVDVGGMGHEHMQEIEAKVVSESISPSINAARTCGIPVIYVNNSAPKIAIAHSELAKICKRSFDLNWEEWGSENTVDPKEYVYGDSTALAIPDQVAPQSQDYFLRKHAYSGFFETRLDGLLRNLEVKSLICLGFSLDVCLGSTMVDAMNLNYQVVLLRDATLAQELPDDLEDLSFTKRLITLTEYSIGFTAASNDFIAACDELHD
ncbi:MAG: hypothetical protein CL398_10915 [Acidiferrobacteraceae bacterium]|nr:hypothetical protein [Acidiferrobacteraceae bacterium]|tara:strand:- start:170 stop:898 length:729 start_codon:yes stop_codon:yes gene_type:complete